MATDGTPEPSAKRCGEAIARLRTARRWSRAQLLIRLFDELCPDDPSYSSISETWLARLENGRMVKVPRQTIEALCRALRCTAQERAWVLLYADRSVLAESDGQPTPAAELLTYVMDRLYQEASEALNGLVGQRAIESLDETELLEVTANALDTLIAQRRRQLAISAGHPAYSARPGYSRHAAHNVATGRPAHTAHTVHPTSHQPRDGRIALAPSATH